MTAVFASIPRDSGFAIGIDDKTLTTPGKQTLLVPTKALADAITAEWRINSKFSPSKMPFTSLAYTAIDQVNERKSIVVESLMTYVDTDTLVYRSTGSDNLCRQQKMQWDPVLDWAGKKLGGKWNVTAGIMPIDQPEALHDSIHKYLNGLDEMRLAVMCVLSASFSSLVLAMSVMDGYLKASEAFRLSRLEEESQAEAWGRDEEADKRAARLKDEIINTARFLDLLNTD